MIHNEKKFPIAIIVLKERTVNSLRWEKDFKEDDELKIIPQNQLESLQFKFETSPKLNQIYIQHPYKEGLYISPELDPHELQRLKLNNISQICAILGAKSFKTILTNKKVTISEKEANGTVDHPAANFEVGVKDKYGKELSHYYEVNHEYEGREPDIDGAYDFLLYSGLVKDKSITQLIERRNPKYGNLSKKESLIVNMSKEIEESFEFGAKLKAMAGALKVEINYRSKDVEMETIRLEIHIDF